jgi:uncharacterized protein (DUF1778 family)
MSRDARVVIRLSRESKQQLEEAAGIEAARLRFFGGQQSSVAAFIRRTVLAHAKNLIEDRDRRVSSMAAKAAERRPSRPRRR